MNQQQSILVLDDNPAQRMAMLLQLAMLGYHNTCEAANGAAALAQIDRLEQLDVVICDIRMSQMDGIEFLRRLAAHRLRPAILICSAVEESLRRSVLFLAAQSGLPVLGDIGKPIPTPLLGKLLQRQPAAAASAALEPVPAALHDALGGPIFLGDFSAYYQPQYALHTLDMTGFEIQCRWQHPLHGLLLPALFMPQLSADQRYTVNRHITEQGLRFVSTLQRRDLTLNVSVPLADVQLQSAGLPDMVQDYLERYRLSPASLSLEVNAADFAQAPLVTMENLVRLRLTGCHLTLQADPANLPSLQHLHELPFDQLKLDARHTRPGGDHEDCRAAMTAAIASASSLGIQVIIDGIHNWQENQVLLHLGCQLGSGDWYAAAMNEQAFAQWIQPALRQRLG
ncbi:EAL domain-containing protein [Collimonas pratensis]|uniref:EAL domain-containing protein n=1 Tax=Collimonas pratensis TaxID=279113 RepID=UPI00143E0E01|nr:EAL domain-containing response regulator [Collimonas pratensis]NKI70664.1 EAL domain-containing protein [Collimonas pratensis]